MAKYNLTDNQKKLLRDIVAKVIGGKTEPLIPVYSGRSDGGSIIGVGDYGSSLRGDLQQLVKEKLLSVYLVSSGKGNYSITQLGYDAVDNDFQKPPESTPQVNLGAYINTMHGGNVQAAGYLDNSELKQIVNDPSLLSDQLENLTALLLDSVKADLEASALIKYTEAITELKEQFNSGKPDSSIITRLTGTLAFFGDIEGTISLILRVMPYINNLMLLASALLSQ